MILVYAHARLILYTMLYYESNKILLDEKAVLFISFKFHHRGNLKNLISHFIGPFSKFIVNNHTFTCNRHAHCVMF